MSSTIVRALIGACCAVSAAACGGGGDDAGDDDNTTGIPDECNPLGADGCLMPWPSAAYVVDDDATATGRRLALPIEAMPENIDRISVDPAPYNRWDGASAVGPILARFPGGVSADGLPSYTDPDASLAAGSPIVLVNLDTGERWPFFAEVDMNVSDPAERTLIIRPLRRLARGAHYGVGIRDTVRSASGGALPVSAGFEAARSGGAFPHPRFAAATAGFDALFAALEAEGVPRGELVLAWDFYTASDASLRHDMTEMVAQAKAAIGTNGANLSFAVDDEPDPGVSYKRYLGHFTSPNFLSNGEVDSSVLRRGADGTPTVTGMRDANFAAIIPSCVADQPLPRPTVLFGHGLFGSAEDYLDDGFTIDLAEDFCFVVIAGDFIGLTMRQLALAPLAANDVNQVFWITDKLQQSIVDFIALEQVMRGAMQTSTAFTYEGEPVIDPSRIYYLGGSLGGTMGNTFLAYDETIRRGVLAVPGGNWSLLFERSAAWTLLEGAARGAYPDPTLNQMLIALMGMAFEGVDPITVAADVPIAGGENPRHVLLWMGIGDSLVTNIATEMVAREMNLPVTGPSVKQPWGLTVTTEPQTSALTIIDEHREPLPSPFNMPEDDNGTHSGCNRRAALLREAQLFLLDDEITHQCAVGGDPAPCDCAVTGACD